MYENNLKLFKKFQPKLAKRLEALPFEEVPAVPEKAVTDDMNGVNAFNAQLMILYGIGDGQHLIEISKVQQKYSSFIVIEKDLKNLRYVMEKHDLKDVFSKNVNFLVDIQAEDMQKVIHPHLWNIVIGKYVWFFNRYGIGDDINWYREVLNEIKRRTNHHYLAIRTTMGNTEVIHSNIFNNIQHIAQSPGIRNLFGKFKNVPGFLVASGPSLDKNIDKLKEIKGKYPIICVDTALKTLLKNGIAPDLCVGIDYSHLNPPKFENLSSKEGYYCAFLPAMKNETFEEMKGQTFVYYANSMFYMLLEQALEDKGFIQGGGSVSHYSLGLMDKLGFNPIIFMGLDLAFEGTKTHSSGTIYDEVKYPLADLEAYPEVDGLNGKVRTSTDMWSFITEFEKMTEFQKHTEFINCTEGGATIAGVPNRPLVDVLKDIKGKEVQGIDDTFKTAFNKPTDINYELSVFSFNKIIDDFKKAQKLSKEATVAADELIVTIEARDHEKAKKAKAELMGKVDDIIALNDLSELIESLMLNTTYKTNRDCDLRQIYYPERKDAIKNTGNIKQFLTEISDVADFYIDKFSTAIEKIKAISDA